MSINITKLTDIYYTNILIYNQMDSFIANLPNFHHELQLLLSAYS